MEELRVAVDPGYPSFSQIDGDGQLVGFDIDRAKALCNRLDVRSVIVRHNWEDLIPGLRAVKFDANISCMSITEKQREQVAFTDR